VEPKGDEENELDIDGDGERRNTVQVTRLE